MDGFSFHPYPFNSGAAVAVDALPSDPDHLGLIDQDVLVRLLGKAFDGTAQVGRGIPILYDEFGIRPPIPGGDTASFTAARACDDAARLPRRRRRRAYKRAIQLAYCQLNVAGMLLFPYPRRGVRLTG